MSSGSPIPETPVARRWGVGFAAIWLFFLLDPLLDGWHHRDTAAGVLGMALTVAFGACYLWVFIAVRRDRAQLSLHPPRSTAVQARPEPGSGSVTGRPASSTKISRSGSQ